ncbi:SAM-dependent methyltransferase [Streptomyces sp. S186]|uniref:SAM-dependent methyltransferase n=1 Tax=Streptomyces sp. S186 TaxID=3434395 RepID=UPI003F6616BD
MSEDAATRDFVTEFMRVSTQGHWGRGRQQHELRAFLDGLEIQEPGLVEVSTWRRPVRRRAQAADAGVDRIRGCGAQALT